MAAEAPGGPSKNRRANAFAAAGLGLGVVGGTAAWVASGNLLWLFLGISLGTSLGLLAGPRTGGGGPAEPGDGLESQ